MALPTRTALATVAPTWWKSWSPQEAFPRAITFQTTVFLLLGAALFFLNATTGHAGTIVSASCPCGYSKKLSLFGGRRNFKTVCLFPALDTTTHDIALYNVFEYPDTEKSLGPPGLISYASPRLMPEHPSEAIAFWRIQSLGKTLTLYQGGYVCPRCGQRTMTFRSVGSWD